ncbi:NADH dehydrogenase [ubiquinone] 1 alpha subcomplex subunit 13-A Protein [Vigna angularis]|uniref:NADH dehydrogenase [ubiquinone] 1 alpha subcomplex subunit 13 n=1 Tax=Phaseolus angularis TaxID=3914 RepID=A0A8T0KVR6_PHAAN|nr:NADH dehydrogenase [ubiquinone] 1 alpha subcomplex subunit 13-A Protein [Vigna angularis]
MYSKKDLFNLVSTKYLRIQFYRKFDHVKCFRALKEEKYAARRSILPVLQAEEDERFVREWHKYLAYEAEVMKDVPGWKVGESVYNSGRWVPPASAISIRICAASCMFVTFWWRCFFGLQVMAMVFHGRACDEGNDDGEIRGGLKVDKD